MTIAEGEVLYRTDYVLQRPDGDFVAVGGYSYARVACPLGALAFRTFEDADSFRATGEGIRKAKVYERLIIIKDPSNDTPDSGQEPA